MRSRTTWHSTSLQREETVALLMWGVKREIRGCLTLSAGQSSARNLRHQNTAWQVEKQHRKKATVAQADTEEAQ